MTGDTLLEIQALMSGAVVRTSRLMGDPEIVRAAASFVADGVRLSPVEQLEIYREQFWLRHLGAMADDFATIHELLGESAFESLCEAYLATHPPTSFTLRDLGTRFADFVHGTEPWAKDELIWDCARLEWAFVEAFDAPDAPPLDPTQIASAPEAAWASARVVFHPSVQLLAMSHPAQVFRAQVRDATAANAARSRPARCTTHVVVFRGPEKLMYVTVEPLAFDLLTRLSAGTPLDSACQAVAETASLVDTSVLEAKVGGWFQAWTAYGWVSRVDF